MSLATPDGPARRRRFTNWLGEAGLTHSEMRGILARSSGVPCWDGEVKAETVPIEEGWRQAADLAATEWPDLYDAVVRVRDRTALRVDPSRVAPGIAITVDLGGGSSTVLAGAAEGAPSLMAHEFGHALNAACRDAGTRPFPEWAREVAACAVEALTCPNCFGTVAAPRIDAGLAQLAQGMLDPDTPCDTIAAQGLGAALIRDASARALATVFSDAGAAHGLIPTLPQFDVSPMRPDPALWCYPLSFYRLLGAVLRIDLRTDGAILSETIASYFAAFCRWRVEGRLDMWLDETMRPVGYVARDVPNGPIARLILPADGTGKRLPPFEPASDDPYTSKATEDPDLQLGAVVKLLAVSDTHRLREIGSYLRSDVLPALRTNQCAVSLDADGHPNAFATWAHVKASRCAALLEGTTLSSEDWSSGSTLYVNDFVAPFGTALAFARQLARGPFRGEAEALAVRRRSDASVRKRFSARH